MATNASNANPGLTVPASEAEGAKPSRPADEREALQALLAFSTLNDQIRRRREDDARRYADGLAPADNAWEYQQFVLDEVLQLVAERAQSITGADGIAIALAEGDAIICRASVGSMAPDRGARIDPKAGFSGACLVSRRIIRCDNAESDPRVDLRACRALGVRSMVAVPLLGQENVVGLVEAFSTEPFGFTDNHVRSLNLLAELILAALKPEDEERIMRAAKAATADFEDSTIERLRQVPFSAAATAPPPPVPTTAEPQDTPLELSRENLAPSLYEGPEDTASRTIWIVIAVLVGAILLGLAIWWKVRDAGNTSSSVAQAGKLESKGSAKPGESIPSPAAATVVASTPSSTAEPPPTPSKPLTPGATPQVLGIRHWMASSVSTVAIDLQAEVQYETHRLENPDRIYFDLRDTELHPGLNGKTVVANEGELLKIRVAQSVPGTTRVVLETKGVANFSVRMEQNPYRLLIEIRGPEAVAPKSVPAPSPALEKKQETPAASLPEKQAAPSSIAAAGATPNRDIPLRAATPSLRIVIDAGHGGWDLGTVGRHGLLEKDLVLDVAKRLGATLEAKLGAEVQYTRKEDTYLSLEQRAELANQDQADLFVSVHANYSDLTSARGVETYYSSFFSPPEAREAEFGDSDATPVTHARLSSMQLKDKVEGSRKLAASVQRSLFGTLTAANPGIRNRGVREASYVVLTGTEMPSILTEISFVSSPEDETRLQNPAYRQQIADALYKGIAQYVSSSPRIKMASASAKPSGR